MVQFESNHPCIHAVYNGEKCVAVDFVYSKSRLSFCKLATLSLLMSVMLVIIKTFVQLLLLATCVCIVVSSTLSQSTPHTATRLPEFDWTTPLVVQCHLIIQLSFGMLIFYLC